MEAPGYGRTERRLFLGGDCSRRLVSAIPDTGFFLSFSARIHPQVNEIQGHRVRRKIWKIGKIFLPSGYSCWYLFFLDGCSSRSTPFFIHRDEHPLLYLLSWHPWPKDSARH